ncbi:hypothetical protein GPECTOR_51g690 [Gonium pectorale]|uniref:Uncharacterized protein n=1 Tax=Gonium pectorale TaxID=33097 RepID=A0A150G821_GONPE|nr:hypothetical protein GPECTOR_51g690 [Gonium pectorale]|eukprot:KXZ45705.1 hypothetical protein GPECTOR_51g690 [Gonium pectorale]
MQLALAPIGNITLPPIDWSQFASPPPIDDGLNVSRSFGGNCTIQPPPDCNGHGHLGGKCFCVCDKGYASDYSNLLAPRWCVPATYLPSAANRTVDLAVAASEYSNENKGFLYWAGGTMGTTILTVVPGVILILTLCVCCICYRRWKRQREMFRGFGAGSGSGSAKDRAAHYHYHGGGYGGGGGGGGPGGGGKRSTGVFFKTWWERKRSLGSPYGGQSPRGTAAAAATAAAAVTVPMAPGVSGNAAMAATLRQQQKLTEAQAAQR